MKAIGWFICKLVALFFMVCVFLQYINIRISFNKKEEPPVINFYPGQPLIIEKTTIDNQPYLVFRRPDGQFITLQRDW